MDGGRARWSRAGVLRIFVVIPPFSSVSEPATFCAMKSARILGLSVLALLFASGAACSSTTVANVDDAGTDAQTVPSGTSTSTTTSTADASLPPNDGSTGDATSEVPKNPYGVPYPTKNLGWTARVGNTPGSVIPNVSVTGYLPGKSLTSTLSLVDVFDPDGKTHDLVAVLLCASWDPISNKMMADLSAAAPNRVALFSVMGQGPTVGVAATLTNLETWRAKVPSVAFNTLDPSFSQFTGVRVTAFPTVVLLDARTMEIVSLEQGAPSDPKATFEADAATVKARPPAF
jgi:hypothetical protein